MNNIILSGSPKGRSKESNSRIFAETFISRMQDPCEIHYIAGSNYVELAQYAAKFDTIIMILPLYIHAMPGIVKKFIEVMEPASEPALRTKSSDSSEQSGKSIGFIVQAGFMETAQHAYLEPYFKDLAEQLHYTYLGTVSKGEAAGVYMFPKMFKKLLASLADLGAAYEKTHMFDPDIVGKLAQPVTLSKRQLRLLRAVQFLHLDNIGWHRVLRKNKAYHLRLERPYA